MSVRYSEDFKKEVVKAYMAGDKSTPQLAVEFNVAKSSVNAIVREMDNVCKALPCGELLQHSLLIGYGIALTLLVIIFAKVITAQSFVQSCNFLIFSHNLRSFLRF